MKTLVKIFTISFICLLTINISAREIKGIVYNESGKPIAGVQVFARGTTTIAFTNENGEYSINVPDSTISLVCDYPGMNKASSDIGNETEINIYMAPLNSDANYDLSIEDLKKIKL